MMKRFFILCIWLCITGLCEAQPSISAQTENDYREILQHIQPSTRVWLNKTKPGWQKNPVLSQLLSAIKSQFPSYNEREQESLALVIIIEAIRENEKERNALKAQQLLLTNDANSLTDIKNRFQNQAAAIMPDYYNSSKALIAKYSLGTNKNAAAINTTPVKKETGKNISEPVSRDSLSASMRELEAAQEEVRNKRQMVQTSFQAIDQKVNQLYQILASVTKTMNEIKMGPVRNLL